MKKRMLAALLALSMVLTLGAGAFAAGDENDDGLSDAQKALEEAKAGLAESLTRNGATSDVDPSDMEWDEFLAWVEENDAAHGHGDAGPSEDELNDYSLTEEDMQALADALDGFDREDIDNAFEYIRLTMDRILTTYAEAIADILDGGNGGQGAAEAISADTNGFLGSEGQLEAVAAISDWLEQQQISEDRTDDFFLSLFGNTAIDVEGKYEPFMEELLSGGEKRPAKTAEDPIFDEDAQEIMAYMARSISEEYLVPNGIGPDDLAWPTDQAAWEYYNDLLDQIYTETAIGGTPEPISEDLVPASPDKEIMDAAAQGVANWLYEFESVESGYLDHLYALLKDSQYIMENVTFA